MANLIILQEGDKIHLKSKEGIYTVVKTESNGVHVSCKTWINNQGRPDIIPTEFFAFNEIKCLAGGYHNTREFERYPINHIAVNKQRINA